MAYLFVHFIGEMEEGEQIYFSVSRDGLHWTDLGSGPALVSNIGEKGVRDPFIIRNRLNDKFYIIATDLRIASGKGWDAAQFQGSTSLIVWEADCLTRWGRPCRVEIPEMDRLSAGCVWAPEAFFDKSKEAYLMYWASMIDGKQRIFAAHTTDFHAFNNVHTLIEKKQHVIDTTVAEEDGVYYRFSASADYAGTLMERSSVLDSPDYEVCTPEGVAGTQKTEGPIITYLEERKQWCLYVDDIGNQAGYIPLVANKLSERKFTRLPKTEFDFGIRRKRHGGILPITELEYEELIAFYGTMSLPQDISL